MLAQVDLESVTANVSYKSVHFCIELESITLSAREKAINYVTLIITEPSMARVRKDEPQQDKQENNTVRLKSNSCKTSEARPNFGFRFGTIPSSIEETTSIH